MENGAKGALAAYSAGHDSEGSGKTSWNNFRLNAFDLLPDSFDHLRSLCRLGHSLDVNLSEAYPASVWITPFWSFVRVTARASNKKAEHNFDILVNFLHTLNNETARSVRMGQVIVAQCATISRLALVHLFSRTDLVELPSAVWKCIYAIHQSCYFPSVEQMVSATQSKTILLNSKHFGALQLQNLTHWRAAWTFVNENQRVRIDHSSSISRVPFHFSLPLLYYSAFSFYFCCATSNKLVMLPHSYVCDFSFPVSA